MTAESPSPSPSAAKSTHVRVSLVGGHCEEEEDDLYNDDLYLLLLARDGNGETYTGSSGLVQGLDEGDDFSFDDVTVYEGAPNGHLTIGLIAMESESDHSSKEIQKYWGAATRLAGYVPAYGGLIQYGIKGLNEAIKKLDKDDRLAEGEWVWGPEELYGTPGSTEEFTWEFSGRHYGSTYRYTIRFDLHRF